MCYHMKEKPWQMSHNKTRNVKLTTTSREPFYDPHAENEKNSLKAQSLSQNHGFCVQNSSQISSLIWIAYELNICFVATTHPRNLSLCLTKYQAMKLYWGGGISPRIL
jgi:hypothetical protein